MSKKLLCLLGILLTIIVGTILHWCFNCDCGSGLGNKGATNADSSVVAVPDEKIIDIQQAASDSAMIKSLAEARLKLANSLILNYEINQSEIILSQEEKNKLEEIAGYLKKDPAAGLTITGYTDNTGNRIDNMKLGQERADRVKAYLEQNGIAGNRITCNSNGPDEPVADNSTPAGRAKNRRTVISIK
jgi:outer membrane protein OmpA-like peptidoglycan-associated protein